MRFGTRALLACLPILLLSAAPLGSAQENRAASPAAAVAARRFRNPIIPGFNPDPSVCRVGDDYYLVTSSFEFFPGIPIYHSRDLVHWEQLGHVLSRPSQLDLDGIRASGGVFAPTIRYHGGVFYVVNTLVGKKGNFIVTAANPAGPWSDPIWLEGAEGIDPSLFFDDDGKVYYQGNGRPANQPAESRRRHIWLQELDVTTMRLVGEKTILLEEGALHGAASAEAPHLYKVGGYYYLMIAEGGTGENHAVTIFRSRSLRGPYEGNRKNPIITNRHLGREFPIACTGHADLVETPTGEWWMVLLGTRPYGGFHYNLGRETFLARVVWEDGWPVVNPGVGRIDLEGTAPSLPEHAFAPQPAQDDFDGGTLGLAWNFLRTPREPLHSLTDRPGFLRLKLRPQSVTNLENPSFVGRRQQHIRFEAQTAIEFRPAGASEAAGVVLLQNNAFHFRLEILLSGRQPTVRLTERRNGSETILGELPVRPGRVLLRVWADGQDYGFAFAEKPGAWTTLREKVDGRILSRTLAGGFTGAYIGLYASSNGLPSTNVADFDWFRYEGN